MKFPSYLPIIEEMRIAKEKMVWDEIRKRQNPHAGTMNTAMSVDEEMVFDAIEQDPNAEEFY